MNYSIAMATYNGAKYIQAQLNSFIDQTIQSDELIICDDGSTDNTVGIIKQFQETAPFNVKLFINDKRLGYGQNFGKALSFCKGDLIFLSDQDDVWKPNKIKTMVDLISLYPQKHVFYNDAEFTNEDLIPSGITRISQLKKLKKNVNFFLQGSCSVIRRNFIVNILPIPNGVEAHDVWIGWLARYLDVKYIHDKPLQFYRQHDSNISTNRLNKAYKLNKYNIMLHSLSSKGLLADLREKMIFLFQCKQKLNELYKCKQDIFNKKTIESAIINLDYEKELFQRRIYLKKKSIVPRIFSALHFLNTGGYSYFNGYYSFGKDILFNAR